MAEQHIQDFCEDKARKGDGQFAVAFAILELARAQERTAVQLGRLGLGDASTHFGAIEALVMQMKETGEAIATTLSERD